MPLFVFKKLWAQIPSRCAVCHSWPAQAVCEDCATQFASPVHRCHTCALPLSADVHQCGACLRQTNYLDRCLAAVPYAYPWSELLVNFKFQQQPEWARSFALLMRHSPWVEHALEMADVVLPLPLSVVRLQWRGYNQAQLLAQALEPRKCQLDVLLRVRDTPPQSSLPRDERLANVRHAFAVDPLKNASVRGKKVVLVDDVMTSGASLSAAARALRDAGAAHITGLVLCRTQ
jgi:ComF family protein